jgi:cell division protein ZapA (FtsZ GTPase activity inhibitor)
MKNEKDILVFKILGEEYRVKTDIDRDTAKQITKYVDNIIGEIASKSAYASQTKIAVLAALNIAIELFHEKKSREQINEKMNQAYQRMKNVLDKHKVKG